MSATYSDIPVTSLLHDFQWAQPNIPQHTAFLLQQQIIALLQQYVELLVGPH